MKNYIKKTTMAKESNILTAQKDSANIGNIAALIGSFSAIIIFIALYSAWTFGRGMMEAMGFPISLVGFKNGIDFYPELTFQFTAVLVGSAACGFIPSPRSRPRFFHIVFAPLFVIALLGAFGFSNRALVLGIMVGAMFGPFLAVYAIRSLPNKQQRMMFGVFAAMIAFGLHAQNLYLYGKRKGSEILNRPGNTWSEGGMSNTKASDYPLV